jgi:putative oxidoreductase
MVSGIELIGGSLIIVGLFTRFAALPLMATMVVAILTAKRPEIDGIRTLLAFDESVYFAGFLWLAVAGAGKASLDWLIFGRKSPLPRPLLRSRGMPAEQQ